MGIDDAESRVVTGLEPPWILAMLFQQIGIGQTPVAEFTDDQRQVRSAIVGIVVSPGPVGATGKIGDPFVPVVGVIGDGAVVMVVLDVAGHMQIGVTGRVVDDQARRVDLLGPGGEVGQPAAMLGIVDQVGTPVLVDQRPGDDRWMVPVASDHLPKGLLTSPGGIIREMDPVGYLGPDQQA